ncbi:MAG: Gfo/Idh/MocA family oxidoreductase [Gemmatimonadota bacterium]
MLRVAVVGCGKAGENHVREICTLPGARVVALCDIEPLMAEQLSDRYSIARHYGVFETMLAEERPDVVHVATPPQSHVALSRLALDRGSHVVIEKPLTLEYASAESLVQHALHRQRKLTIGHGYHFDPICLSMRRMIADGQLGEPVHVESFMGYAMDGQFGTPVFADSGHWVHGLPGKLVHNIIDHLLNKVMEFVQGDHPTIVAHAMQRLQRDNPAFAMPDEVRIMLSDARVSAYATFSAHARPVGHHLTVYGTRNTMRLDFVAGTLTLQSTSSVPGAVGRVVATLDQSWQHLRAGGANVARIARGDFQYMTGLRTLFERFYDCVRDGTPPPIPYGEILRLSAITDQVFAQFGAERRHSA